MSETHEALTREDKPRGWSGGSTGCWASVALIAILLVAGYLRLTGLNWDEGQYIHPDEGHMRNTLSLISWPDDLSLYFDTHRSPLNVRNKGHQYSYGTLPLFLTRMTTEWLDRACGESPALLPKAVASSLIHAEVENCYPGAFTGIYSAVVGRMLSGLADLGTLCLVYLIARRLYGEAIGLMAAGLAALTVFSIQQAHFFTVDSMACFFTTLVVYFSVRAAQTGHWADFGLAGLAVGLSAACKVSAAAAALLVVLAAVSRLTQYTRNTQHAVRSTPYVLRFTFYLFLAGLLSLIAFRIAQPYAFEGPGFFGVRPSPEWFGRLGQIRAEQAGEIDLPSGRQWANRAPILFPWINMVFWGMGLPLGLAAWVGWTVAGVELFRGKRDHLVLWIWATVVFLYQATRWVKSMRYFLSLYPIFVIFAAYLLIRLLRLRRDYPLLPAFYSLFGYLSFVVVVVGALFWALAFFSIYRRPHTRLAASRWIYAEVPQGVTVANEHWDWGLPLRIDGHDPFGGMYSGFEMKHYDEDTAQKRERLFEWLDETDYIFLASNRLYASISRLPARYPLTIEYYRALFAGELGFDLEADFTSYPALGPFVFPDQENPFALMEADYASQNRPVTVHLPSAEEAFSVYDHPRVLIFRKTEAYSRERVRRVLGDIDVGRAMHGLTPKEVTEVPDRLQFDPQTWADQQAGGTWSKMFDRDSLLNRYPGLAAVAWWAAVTVLGWLAFPLLFAALNPHLRDRGYGLAKVLALLLVAYLTWLAASLHVMPNTRETIARMVLLLVLVGGGVGWLTWDELRRFLGRRWRLLLLSEGLFAFLYVAWLGVRLLHPGLWHPVVGGEKPMDVAYLNAVMKSTWFPPYNPWFSGSWINYYYFGFVIVGTLIKLMGTVPSIAYNLVVPMLFALTGVGAFSVTYNLFNGSSLSKERRRRGALLAGLMALVFVVLLGNLGVVHLIQRKLIELGGELFPSTIPGFPETVALFRGLFKVFFTDASLSIGAGATSWYWHPTRIIPSEAGDPIAEFPAFTFLYADLHAHMIAMPLTLLALTLAVYWVRVSRLPSGRGIGGSLWSSLLLGGLVIGALRPTNTWDYPTYLALGVAALALSAWRRRVGIQWRPLVWNAALLLGLTILLYLPYIRHYAAAYSSFERWQGPYTPVGIYLWIYAIFLWPVVTGLLVGVKRVVEEVSTGLLAVAGVAVVAVTVGLLALGYSVAVVVVPIAALAALLVLDPGRSMPRRLLWLMVAAAMAISLAVEIVVLKGDVGRMNSVFKFYLQVWVMLGIAAAANLAWICERVNRWPSATRELWWGVMIVLILGGALFLPFSIRSRAIDRMAPKAGRTLDGMAFMKHATVIDGSAERGAREIPLRGDYYAIRWMQDHIQGSLVIMEGLGEAEYRWANRVSIHTGLPAVVGWSWHQRQQRPGTLDQAVYWRRDDVDECYNTLDFSRAQEILERYGVRYVYIGEYERAYYDPAGLAKFHVMAEQGLLREVYGAHGVTIYETTGW